MTKTLIIYDLDGTLIDTAPDLLHSLDHIVTGQGLPPIDKNAMRSCVGFGGRVMLQNAYQSAGAHLSEAHLDQLVKDFVAHYADNMPGNSQPFDGLLNSMDDLRIAGHQFAVCTNKTEYLANILLEKLDMDGLFKAVTGQDTFAVRKPHPDHLLGTIERAGGKREAAIMVGDTPTDFATANAAMIPCVAVDFGYCDRPVADYQPDAIISHYSEMNAALIESLI